jgi:outer membrane lipoprotein-sorting protein
MRLGRGVAAAILVTAAAGGAVAQPTSSPAAVLADVQQFYANAHQLTAQFRQVVTNATFNRYRDS